MHRASTSTRWHFAFGLHCHSNKTRAPIANLPKSAQLGGTPYHSPKLHLGPCSSVAMRRSTDRQTHMQTCITNIHFTLSMTHAIYNNSCLLDCIAEMNTWGPNTWMTAICTPVWLCACHVLIHYLQCCTELGFIVQQSSINVLGFFNLKLQGYNCGKFHLNRFSSIWDTPQNKRGVFFSERV